MKILFLCVANSARSQMAEGLAKNILSSTVEIHSAGSEPSGRVHPGAIEAMREIGLDISAHGSKSVEDLPADFVNELDYVITLCAEEVCPAFISKAKRIHWAVEDPAAFSGEEQVRAFQKARDFIKERIENFFRDPRVME